MRSSAPPPAVATTRELSDQGYHRLQAFLMAATGIHLGPAKKTMATTRLQKRAAQQGFGDLDSYVQLITGEGQDAERQAAIDLLTTNETFFFREARHFDFLARWLAERPPHQELRGWSAACSSGEEVYTLAMVLDSVLGDRPWHLLGSDISHRVLERASSALYPLARSGDIPRELLKRYCLRGIGAHEGLFTVEPRLRQRVEFRAINLNAALPRLPAQDFIFLRNVMIYFDAPTKVELLRRLLHYLKPGGLLFVGHSESLAGFTGPLRPLHPSVYRKEES